MNQPLTHSLIERWAIIPICIAVFIIALGTEANANLVVLDFDEIPAVVISTNDLVPVSNQLSDQYLTTYGVKFHSASPWVTVTNSGASAPSQPNMIAGSTTDGRLSFLDTEPVVATFWNPLNPSEPAGTDFVSVKSDLNASSDPKRQIRLFAYDINGIEIDSDVQLEANGLVLMVSSATQNIHRVEFLGTNTNEHGASIDNFTFTEIPEPATLALLVLGGLVVCCRRAVSA